MGYLIEAAELLAGVVLIPGPDDASARISPTSRHRPRAPVAARVRLVGVDYLSVDAFASARHTTHKVLLVHEVIILEGLDLRGIAPGVYELLCLPLQLADGAGDGAPARAVLRDVRAPE